MKTRLYLPRSAYTIKSTTGILFADGEEFFKTLEDRIREPQVKVHGQTCIPSGIYKISRRESPKFKRNMIWLLDTKNQYINFDLVYIHAGNKSEDSDGCILSAKNRLSWDYIVGDALALERKLYNYIDSRGWDDVSIKIDNGPGFEDIIKLP